MNKSKQTKRSLLFSLLAMLLSVAMLAGTTFAWFTDSAVTGTNTISSGNLDLVVKKGDVGDNYALTFTDEVTSSTTLFSDSTLWEPGHTEVAYLQISNAGTLAFKYQLSMNIASETGSTNVNGKAFKLSDYLQYAIVEVGSTGYATRDDARTAATNAGGKTLSTAQEDVVLYSTSNKPEDTSPTSKTIAIIVWMPESVGNEANHKTDVTAPQIKLGVNINATQYTYEEDSFGNTYDENATGNPDYPEWGIQASETSVSVDSLNFQGATLQNPEKSVTVTVPSTASLTDNVTELKLIITPKDSVEGRVTVSDSQLSDSYEIELQGIDASANNVLIKATLNIGKNLTGVKVYHSGNSMEEASYLNYVNTHSAYYYDNSTGVLTITSTSFSPFDILWNKDASHINNSLDFTTAIKTKDYVTLEDDFTYSGKLLIASELTIDLNGHTLTFSNTTYDNAEVKENGKLTIKNGHLVVNRAYRPTTKNGLYVNGGTLNLEKVTCTSDCVTINPKGQGSIVNVRDSSIVTTGAYTIATNAGSSDQYGVTVNVENSNIESTYTNDGTGICFNVPGTLNISGSTIKGAQQGLLLRGGTAKITNSTLINTKSNAETDYMDCEWKDGNNAPHAALVLGNRHSLYQYATVCELENVMLTGGSNKTLYIYANSGTSIGVTLTYKGNNTLGDIIVGSENVTINNEVVASDSWPKTISTNN